ncbi:MAG: hypothetical protein A4E66_00702 [Syntrophus sp. PtaB.Bin001]|nr:MAG: hypothetical protein A4E66_00702 [Syntrophus sp. PtaB.Bin001]
MFIFLLIVYIHPQLDIFVNYKFVQEILGKEENMTVGQSIQVAGIVYLTLAVIAFGVAGMIVLMSKLFK